jgi:hypothetical protein
MLVLASAQACGLFKDGSFDSYFPSLSYFSLYLVILPKLSTTHHPFFHSSIGVVLASHISFAWAPRLALARSKIRPGFSSIHHVDATQWF